MPKLFKFFAPVALSFALSKSRWYADPFLWLAVFLPVLVGIPAWGSDFFYGDESRHALNGALILDWLCDGCPPPMAFALEYYAHYPALSLGYHPPLFPAIAAICYAIFGFSIESARIAVWLCGVVGAGFWYQLVKDFCGRTAAILASLALWCAPEIVYWDRAVMLEIPTSSTLIVASYFLLHYIQTSRTRDLILAAIAGGLAVAMKQTAGIWFLAALSILIWHGGWRCLFSWRMLVAGLIYMLLVAAIGALTLMFGQTNLTENVAQGGSLPRTSLANWIYYLGCIPRQIGWPAAILAGISMVSTMLGGISLLREFYWRGTFATRYRGRVNVFFLSWIAANYILMSLVSYKSSRLGLLWAPPLAGMAALGALAFVRGRTVLTGLLLIVAVIGSLWQAYTVHAPRVQGFAELARIVRKNWTGETALYDGFHNGSFLARLLELDPNRRCIVLRGSKSLSATRVMPRFGVEAIVTTEMELLNFLREHWTGLLILEEKDILDLPHGPALRRLVVGRPDLFEQIGEVQLTTNEQTFLTSSPVRVYRFANGGGGTTGTDAAERPKSLKLRFLTTDETIEVPLR